MRLLLFLISGFFSIIFYAFYNFSNGKDFYSIKNIPKVNFDSLSWNLLFESVVFLFLAFLFFIYFSPIIKPKIILEKVEKNKLTYYILFYTLFFLAFVSQKIFFDTFILFWIIFFIFSDFTFNFLSNLNYFKEQKENLRYFWLFLNFWSSFISIYYLFNFQFSLFLFLILIFNLFFYYFLNKKYENIACLWAFYTIIIFLLLFLILKLYYLIKIILNFN